MTSVYHSSSAEIPPTIIASPPSFSTLVETTVIKGNDTHPNRDPPIDSHPNYVDISPIFLTPEKKINCFSGNFPFDSDFEAMPSKEVADAFLEWYSKGMNMKRILHLLLHLLEKMTLSFFKVGRSSNWVQHVLQGRGGSSIYMMLKVFYQMNMLIHLCIICERKHYTIDATLHF
ncbi:hypothetical protein CsatB_003481 [Cannabis sativa]